LTLKSLGVHNVMDFHYLDRPEELMLLEVVAVAVAGVVVFSFFHSFIHSSFRSFCLYFF